MLKIGRVSIKLKVKKMANNFYCKLCGKTEISNSKPSLGGCPKSSSHTWVDIGPVGGTRYECKCGLSFSLEKVPPAGVQNCPKSSSHSFVKK